jgi:hypothetical protein
MKTKIDEVLKHVCTAIESLKDDSVDKEFTPQLGSALGGLRTAKAGFENHLKSKPAIAPAKPAAN